MLSRSVSGVFPDTAVLGMRPGGVRTELIYETTIPTIESSAEKAARLSRPQREQERARHPGQSPPGGAQALNPGITGRPMAASTPQRLPFGRAARIKQGRDFARVRRAGERLTLGCLIANWQRLPASSTSRLGVITSGRIGGAVVRNRLRRQLRAQFTTMTSDVTPGTYLLSAGPSAARSRVRTASHQHSRP